jgi:hypothetical protein
MVVQSDSTASVSTILKGFEFAVQSHLENVTAANSSQFKSGFKGSVMSISLGVIPRSPALELLVAIAVDAGIHVAVGAVMIMGTLATCRQQHLTKPSQ